MNELYIPLPWFASYSDTYLTFPPVFPWFIFTVVQIIRTLVIFQKVFVELALKVNIFPTVTTWQEECAGTLKVMDRCRQRPDLSPPTKTNRMYTCKRRTYQRLKLKIDFKKLSFNLIFVGLGATTCTFHEHWEMKSHIGDKKVDIVWCVRCSNDVISCRNLSGKDPIL